MRLWYEQPATAWVEALPVGNGRLGAMVFGKTDTEVVQLNEDTLWSGYPRDLNPRRKSASFRQAAKLALERNYHAATELIEQDLTSGWGQSYLPVGELFIEFRHSPKVEGYTRSLDISSAIASVEYRVDGARHRRELFASAPADVIVMRLTADRPKSVAFSLSLKSPIRSSVVSSGGRLELRGVAPSHVEPSYSKDLDEPVVYADTDGRKGMRFSALVRVVAEGGKTMTSDEAIAVDGADSATIIVGIGTSFAGYDTHPFLHGRDFEQSCVTAISNAELAGFNALKSAHIADYRRLYDRVSLDLGTSENSTLPTDKRLYRFRDVQDDPALYTLLFQYGRYLLISSSRPGTQPANLQGIWNSELRPPWSSNFTININTQMNYWPVFSSNLEELNQPLVSLIEGLADRGRTTARELYGARGFASHHNADIWRTTSPMGNHWKGSAGFAFWNMSGVWLCRHLFDQYEYTLDTRFLREVAFPIMKSAAEFVLDLLIEESGGRMIVSPSTSPENSFIFEGKRCSVCATSAMTMSQVRELFGNCIRACEVLNVDHDFSSTLEHIVPRLYGYQIGSRGQLLEWYEEYEEAEPTHRHISHLYGLHPGNEITLEETPELANACRRSLDLRGDEGTGWSLGWKINQWARLRDGDRALKLLARQLRLVSDTGYDFSTGGGTYLNMFDAHPPFQIDGNFGAASGIAEMLLQSRGDRIFVLPALPSTWATGRVSGLRAKRRIAVEIEWNGEKTAARLESDVAQRVFVSVRGSDAVAVDLAPGVPGRIGY